MPGGATLVGVRWLVAGLAVLLAGCGGGEAGTAVEVAGTINYGSFGTEADIDCGQGKSLNVGGSNNVLTVTGTCRLVSVGGADNTITLDRVDAELNVVGLNNTVRYGGDPAVHDSGAGNRIAQR